MFTSVSDCNSSTKSQLTAGCRTRVRYVAANTIVTPVNHVTVKKNTELMRKKVLVMTSMHNAYNKKLWSVLTDAYYRKYWSVLTQWCTSGSLVHFLQFDEQSIYDDATSLVRRPFQLLVAELGVDFMRCSDCFLAHFVAVGRDQNLKCHLAVVSGARLLVFVPVVIIIT